VLGLADAAGLATVREQRTAELLDRVRAVAFSGVSLTLDRAPGVEPHTVLTELLVEVGRAALRQDRVVLLHLDEVQNLTAPDTLSQLLVSLGDALAHQETVTVPGGLRLLRGLPLAVYLTGLPEFADMAGARKGATFARRFATTTLDPLDDDDLRLALHPFVTPGWPVPDGEGGTGAVRMEPEAVDAVVGLAQGEPFLFQLAGERAWYAGSGPVITAAEVREGWGAARREAAAHVERILQRLPPRERQVVDAMAGLAPEERSASTIARAMGLGTAAQIATLAQRLDTSRGLIDRGPRYRFRNRAVEAYLTTTWPHLDGGRVP
jgi:hypothetical protein